MFHQFSEAMCDTIYTTSVKHNKRMRKEHEKRTISFSPLREVVVILDNKKLDENRQLDTSGKTLTVVSTRWLKPRGLKIKKISPSNNYASSGACFLGYLKTLLYGYVLCSMKDPEDSQLFSLSAILQ